MRKRKEKKLNIFCARTRCLFNNFTITTMEKLKAVNDVAGNDVEKNGMKIEIIDNRENKGAFELDAFVEALKLLIRKPDESKKNEIEYRYGKFFQFATAENDAFLESLKEAKAIKVMVCPLTLHRNNKIQVIIQTLVDEKNGKVTNINFDDDNGKCIGGTMTKLVTAQEKLTGSASIDDNRD